jgi:hypothetical protein
MENRVYTQLRSAFLDIIQARVLLVENIIRLSTLGKECVRSAPGRVGFNRKLGKR